MFRDQQRPYWSNANDVYSPATKGEAYGSPAQRETRLVGCHYRRRRMRRPFLWPARRWFGMLRVPRATHRGSVFVLRAGYIVIRQRRRGHGTLCRRYKLLPQSCDRTPGGLPGGYETRLVGNHGVESVLGRTSCGWGGRGLPGTPTSRLFASNRGISLSPLLTTAQSVHGKPSRCVCTTSVVVPTTMVSVWRNSRGWLLCRAPDSRTPFTVVPCTLPRSTRLQVRELKLKKKLA